MAANGASVAQKALWIIALSALIGFGAVYLIGGRFDNATSPDSTAVAQDMSPPSVGAGSESGFKLGKMAAFVTKKTPEALPDVSFEDESGKTVMLSSLKGKTVLLNLWATWCAPCKEEMPSLDRLQQSLGGDGFEVVALSLDRKGYAASRKFLDDMNAHAIKLYADPTSKQGMQLRPIGMPTTILINKDGMEVGRLSGSAEWDSEEAKSLIKSAMN
ncbi:TlpA family protein disulfide reductase [Hyphomicrobium methylovorum]|uniref:TlpA family protein disulfide reductase n=1 Tax=Hyphomicrobium methylovorum TaxID=84 RepID=UPI0015E74B80|nr:TlpA family protein disulfide reductase [Hyphomicrobium methylovorum]MBA2126475.1 TlpA family protein disulfide reductase [Hyphomicrobium methylovorum]